MNEVRELDGVLDEEYWGVVTDHVIVAFLGIMLDGETTGITIAIICTSLTCNS